MIDKTDPLTQSQEKRVRNWVSKIKSNMILYEKLSIYVLDDQNYSFPEASFALCNLGTGSDANTLYQNPRMMQLKFEANFGQPLDQALNGIKLGETKQKSPIMEMIANLGKLKDFQPNNNRRRLIIFSDMLQHMPEYSHYRNKIDYTTFEKSDYARNQLIDLQGFDIRIMYLKRKNARRLQNGRHQLFWEKYFDRIGATIKDFDARQ